MRKTATFVLIGFLSISVRCSTDPETGRISVSVIDSLVGGVADVEITITPGDILKTTDEAGVVIFEVDPGDYFVDANVCCAGPGFIEHHVPVSVREQETTEVELNACLACVC